MKTRMDKVAEEIALTVLRKVAFATEPPLQLETLIEAFHSRWPTPAQDRRMPMNDAIDAAALAVSSCTGQDGGSWITAISPSWQQAVKEVAGEYFKTARHSFRKGEPFGGVENLTDAVRATLGHIAATRNWPHSTHDDLYRIAAALGSGGGWPDTTEEFCLALENASEEGLDLSAALGASMGRPDMLKFGVYAENPDGLEEDGFLFATTAIELADRLAEQELAKA